MALLLAVCLYAAPAVAEPSSAQLEALLDRVEQLERRDAQRLERIEELEDQLVESGLAESGRVPVTAFDAVELNFGGFLTQTLSYVDGRDGEGFSANQTNLELLISADLGERVSFFTALGFLREADVDFSDSRSPRFRATQNRVPQIIAWFNYRHSDALQFRAGRFVTPHGIINIEHFPPSLLEIQQPQFLRPFPGATLFPNFMNGLQVHGRQTYEEGSLTYSAYLGSFNAAPEERLYGGRIAWSWDEHGVTIGANYGGGKRSAGTGPLGNQTIVPVLSADDNEYDLAGLDLLIDRGRLLWKTEIFHTWERGTDDRIAFYTQPAWRLTESWLAFYRYDYLDAGQGLAPRTEHVVGLNYDFSSNVRLRGALFRSDQNGTHDNTTFGQLSATVSF